MPGNSEFQMVKASGWSGGLQNLLRADFGKWFHTRRWWTQALTWTLVFNGLLLATNSNPETSGNLDNGLLLYALFSSMFSMIAIIIMMQSVIVGERDSGTAAWVLSKPVSRVAFILSKLLPNLVSSLVCMVLVPGLVAFAQLSYFNGSPLNPLWFLAGLSVIWIFISFFLALTLMLGTFFSQRGPVIGIALAFGLGQQILIGISPFLPKVLPWALANPISDTGKSIAVELFLGQPISEPLPLIITSVCLIAFIAISLWQFNKEEF